MTLEHSSVVYFQVILAHFNGGYIFVLLFDNIFFKHKVEEYFARYYFFKRKSDLSQSEIG